MSRDVPVLSKLAAINRIHTGISEQYPIDQLTKFIISSLRCAIATCSRLRRHRRTSIAGTSQPKPVSRHNNCAMNHTAEQQFGDNVRTQVMASFSLRHYASRVAVRTASLLL